MTLYEIICDVNERVIKGEPIENEMKQDIVNHLLGNVTSKEDMDAFRRRNKNKMEMYPFYYIPPYNNGNKLRIISGYKPKTEIFSTNHYELEILRILTNWADQNSIVKEMVNNTLSRLDKTCFGHFCPQGECLGASVSVLRFLNTVCTKNDGWIKKLLKPQGELFVNQRGMGMKNYFPFYYFCLVLSELPINLVDEYIFVQKEFLKRMLTRGCLTGPHENDAYNILILYIIRNTLCRIKEYEYIKNEKIYVKDNRCYCKI